MATVVEVADRAALVAYIAKALEPFDRAITDEMVTVKQYCYDGRIGWDTHIVTVEGYGVFGFTDAPVQ